MIVRLSSKRNEKICCEWSGDISEKHAQDFCDVANAVFGDHFDLDYMRRKYEENCYGRSFILVIYQDELPVATWGAWRNDLWGKVAFQLCDFATLPSVRKKGYVLDLFSHVCDEVGQHCSGATIYGFPGTMSYPVNKAMGWATANFYLRCFCGMTKDFLDSVPAIEEVYVEEFFSRKKKLYVMDCGGERFLLRTPSRRTPVPAGMFLGRVGDAHAGRFPVLKRPCLLFYRSLRPGIFFRHRRVTHVAKYVPGATRQIMDAVPPLYKVDSYSLDFNGSNAL